MIERLSGEEALDGALERELVLIYKHSPVCFASTRAHAHIRKLSEERPEMPILMVDVISDRPLSQAMALRLGIRHESPQTILVRRGSPLWHASHGGVRADRISEAIDDAQSR